MDLLIIGQVDALFLKVLPRKVWKSMKVFPYLYDVKIYDKINTGFEFICSFYCL